MNFLDELKYEPDYKDVEIKKAITDSLANFENGKWPEKYRYSEEFLNRLFVIVKFVIDGKPEEYNKVVYETLQNTLFIEKSVNKPNNFILKELFKEKNSHIDLPDHNQGSLTKKHDNFSFKTFPIFNENMQISDKCSLISYSDDANTQDILLQQIHGLINAVNSEKNTFNHQNNILTTRMGVSTVSYSLIKNNDTKLYQFNFLNEQNKVLERFLTDIQEQKILNRITKNDFGNFQINSLICNGIKCSNQTYSGLINYLNELYKDNPSMFNCTRTLGEKCPKVINVLGDCLNNCYFENRKLENSMQKFISSYLNFENER